MADDPYRTPVAPLAEPPDAMVRRGRMIVIAVCVALPVMICVFELLPLKKPYQVIQSNALGVAVQFAVVVGMAFSLGWTFFAGSRSAQRISVRCFFLLSAFLFAIRIFVTDIAEARMRHMILSAACMSLVAGVVLRSKSVGVFLSFQRRQHAVDE